MHKHPYFGTHSTRTRNCVSLLRKESCVEIEMFLELDFEIVAVESLALLKSISEKLLKAKAYERFDSSSIPEIVVKNSDDAIFRLKDISKGILKLSDSVQAPKANIFTSSYGSGDSSQSINQPLFTRNRMWGI